jgi:RNA polymerase sigma-70 factor (ECF subfamily)
MSENQMNRKIAFEVTYKRHFNAFYKIAFHFLQSTDDAHGVVQEAFIKLLEQKMDLQYDQQVKNYLFIVVRNQCLNILRDRKKNYASISNKI